MTRKDFEGVELYNTLKANIKAYTKLQDVDDIVNEAYLRVLKRIDKLDYRSTPINLLFITARNIFLTQQSTIKLHNSFKPDVKKATRSWHSGSAADNDNREVMIDIMGYIDRIDDPKYPHLKQWMLDWIDGVSTRELALRYQKIGGEVFRKNQVDIDRIENDWFDADKKTELKRVWDEPDAFKHQDLSWRFYEEKNALKAYLAERGYFVKNVKRKG